MKRELPKLVKENNTRKQKLPHKDQRELIVI